MNLFMEKGDIMLVKILMLMTIAFAIACGGGKTENEDHQNIRYTTVIEGSQIIGYNFTMDDGSVLFVPIDEMPPAAPVGLEAGR